MNAINTHAVPFTFFEDQRATSKEQEDWTLPDIAYEIQVRTARSKERLPWLKMAVFGDRPSKKNCLRNDKNLLAITGVEIDYDAGDLTFDEGVQRVIAAGLRALVYTSPSYKKGVTEKWRVLCPTSIELPPTARYDLVANLNGVIGGGIDPKSFTLSQSFYYGSVDDNPEHRVELVEGDYIDLRPDLAAGAIGRPPREGKQGNGHAPPSGEAPGYSDEDIKALLQKSQIPGHWYNSMLSVTSSLVLQGKTTSEIYDRVAHCCDGGWGDPEIEVMITSAREKWGKMDPDEREGLYAAIAPIVAEAAAAAGVPAEPDWRERYKGGTPKPSLQNAILAIQAAGIRCTEDVFHNKMWLGIEQVLPFRGEVTDASIRSLRKWLSDRHGFDLTESHVRDAVMALAHEGQFNPVADMLAEAEASWDGVKRLDRVAADYFNCEDTDLNAACVRKVLVAAVARVRQPGIKFDTILVMESPEGWNKSTVWSVMAGEGNFSDERIIGHAAKEVQEQLAGVWIHENADLAGMAKREVETVKAFASRQVDRARPAYGRFLKEQPRHSIEVGTTNAKTYLQSPTGNRRFWPVRVVRPIDIGKLRNARLQIWGEAARAQTAGESLVLEQRLWPVVGVEQEGRRTEHPWEALLDGMVEVPADGPLGASGIRGPMVLLHVDGEHRVRTKDIFEQVLSVTGAQMHIGHSKTLSEIMQRLGWANKKFKVEGLTVSGYVRPAAVKSKRKP